MDRGMKKWAPYKSLVDQYEHLDKLRKEKEKVEKPKISNDRAEEINEILTNYHGEDLKVTYYKKGEIFSLISPIFNIDVFNKILIFSNYLKIRFKDLINLERI